jgi:hypothetical protein
MFSFFAVLFRNESIRGTQRRNDELLRVVADLQSLERRDGHRGYDPGIGP